MGYQKFVQLKKGVLAFSLILKTITNSKYVLQELNDLENLFDPNFEDESSINFSNEKTQGKNCRIFTDENDEIARTGENKLDDINF